MMTANVSADIEEFATRVREHLSDLGAEEIEELTGGLEADLAEELNERPADSALRDPEGYALELRTAAGLPPRPTTRAKPLAGPIASLREQRMDAVATLRTNAFFGALLDFAVTLHPAWWLLRAWVAYQIFSIIWGGTEGLLPRSAGNWLLLALFAIISVQWGRGQWLPLNWMRGLIVAGNVAAIVLLMPVVANANGYHCFNPYCGGLATASAPVVRGVALNGEQVQNIFAYDAQGKPIENVQLFDRQGHPLTINPDPARQSCYEYGECENTEVPVAGTLETGAKVWNIFPAHTIGWDQMRYDPQTDRSEPVAGFEATEPTSPFIKVPGVLEAPKPEPSS